MARLLDFYYKLYDAPKEHGNWPDPVLGKAVFNIGGDKDEWGESDFWDALTALKEQVPLYLRSYDPKRKEWSVFMTKQVEETLCDIFENADGLIEDAKSQLSFPW